MSEIDLNSSGVFSLQLEVSHLYIHLCLIVVNLVENYWKSGSFNDFWIQAKEYFS